ncbi:MAG: hypothetical protein AABN33_06515 [Acidobacteriota bacterium]
MQKVGPKLRGHYGYYGVTDNYRGVARYHREVTKIVAYSPIRDIRSLDTPQLLEKLTSILPSAQQPTIETLPVSLACSREALLLV